MSPIFVSIVCVAGAAASVIASPSLPTVVEALTGEPVPGLPIQSYASFESARLNASGDLLFGIETSFSSTGIVRRISGTSAETVALSGTASPVAGEPFDFLSVAFNGAILTQSGGVVFKADLEGNGDAFDGIFEDIGAGVTAVAVFNSVWDGFRYGFSESGRLSAAGDNVAFYTYFQDIDFDFDEAIVARVNGERVIVAREGNTLPGSPDVLERFDSFSFYPSINAAGDMAFSVEFANVATNRFGFYSRSVDGAITKIAFEDENTPGSNTRTFESLGNGPRVLPNGDVVFTAGIGGFDSGVYRWDHATQSITALLEAGDLLPTIGTDRPFRAATDNPLKGGAFNSAGDFAFNAFLQIGPGVFGSTDGLVIAQIAGENIVIAREGSDAPGLGSLDFFTAGSVQINNIGDVAWITSLQVEGSVTFADDTALSLRDGLTGAVTTILREGDAVEVAPGDSRTVSTILLDAPNGFDTPGGLSDSGEIAYTVSFTDGSEAVLVSTFRTDNPADLNADGTGNVFDLLDFLELFDAGDLSADLNGDGSLNTDDVELMIRITRG